jgi:hypothetical protein
MNAGPQLELPVERIAPAWRRWIWLAPVAPALWLLWLSPPQLLGFDTGAIGSILLCLGFWLALWQGRSAAPDLSPGEEAARLGLFFGLAITGYFLAKADLLGGLGSLRGDGAFAVGRNLGLMIVAWIVMSWVLVSRYRGVQEDERDRAIAATAAGWWRGAMVFQLLGLVVTLGLSPAERVAWATPIWVANLLLFALLWSWVVEHAVAWWLYRRDRA